MSGLPSEFFLASTVLFGVFVACFDSQFPNLLYVIALLLNYCKCIVIGVVQSGLELLLQFFSDLVVCIFGVSDKMD